MIASNITWPGGIHSMSLGLAQLEGLQRATDAGPEFLLNKIRLGQWTVGDLFEVLRWGLIGGGLDPVEAETLNKRLFGQQPLASFKVPAMEVLALALYGPSDDPVGEDGPVENPTPEEQKTENGSLAHSMG